LKSLPVCAPPAVVYLSVLTANVRLGMKCLLGTNRVLLIFFIRLVLGDTSNKLVRLSKTVKVTYNNKATKFAT